MPDPREIELKLELEPASLWRLRRLLVARGWPEVGTKQLHSTYYDTPGATLRKQGLSLRVRRDGERRVQTVKAVGGATAGIFDRPEWETEIAGDEPDLHGLPERLNALGKDTLAEIAPLFSTEVSRTTWTPEHGGSTIDVVLDEGEVKAGDATRRIGEVELELRSGTPADLFALARGLAEEVSVRLSVQPKAELGFALLENYRLRGIKAGPVRLSADMKAGDAFRTIALSCLAQFRLNEPGLVEDRAVDSLHQARVALRRLRSALSLFKKVTADADQPRMARELKAIASLLGEARNLDVFIARVTAAEELPGRDELVLRLTAEREATYERVIRRLSSKRFRVFMIDLVAWIECGPWRTAEDNAGPRERDVTAFAAKRLERLRRRVKRKGKHLDRLAPEERHQVRIAAKKLRYASEFFASLYSGGKEKRRHKAFLSGLEQLQDVLGELNDFETGHEVSARFMPADAAAPETGEAGLARAVFAAGRLDGESEERTATLLAAAVEAHAKLVGAKPFWG